MSPLSRGTVGDPYLNADRWRWAGAERVRIGSPKFSSGSPPPAPRPGAPFSEPSRTATPPHAPPGAASPWTPTSVRQRTTLQSCNAQLLRNDRDCYSCRSLSKAKWNAGWEPGRGVPSVPSELRRWEVRASAPAVTYRALEPTCSGGGGGHTPRAASLGPGRVGAGQSAPSGLSPGAGARSRVLLPWGPHLVDTISARPFKDPGNRAPPRFVLQVKKPRILRINPSRPEARTLGSQDGVTRTLPSIFLSLLLYILLDPGVHNATKL